MCEKLNNKKTLKRFGINCEVVHIHPSSHAGYYPGAAPIALKLIFEKETGRIFGAQAVGADGVDKRMDVIATPESVITFIFQIKSSKNTFQKLMRS